MQQQQQQQRTVRMPRVQPDVSNEECLATEDEREDEHERDMSAKKLARPHGRDTVLSMRC